MARIANPLDRQLIEAVRHGDDDAFRRVIDPYRSELTHIATGCWRRRSFADDALQETLMRAWRAMQTFGGDEHLHARLFKFGRCAGGAFLPSSSRERHQIGTNTAFSSNRWVSSFMRPYPTSLINASTSETDDPARF